MSEHPAIDYFGVWQRYRNEAPVAPTPRLPFVTMVDAAALAIRRQDPKMPLRIGRSSTRGTPCGLFGSNGLTAAHS